MDFLFASSKVHMHMGGEIVQNAKDYIFPSVVVVLWLRSQRAKEMQTFSKWPQELELSLCAEEWCVFNTGSHRLRGLFENITRAQC